jgi:hypothetical protein
MKGQKSDNIEYEQFKFFSKMLLGNKNNEKTITEEQIIDLDKYHVKILTDDEKNVLKEYVDTHSKNVEPIFSFFDGLYGKSPDIILCLHDSIEQNLNDIINRNTISILIPAITKLNTHIIESFTLSELRCYFQ